MVCHSMNATGGYPLSYEGTLNEMVDVINNDLVAWAAEWPEPPS